MNDACSKIKEDKVFFFPWLFTLLCITANIFIILVFYGNLPPCLPLFNQMPWGEKRLGIKSEIFIPTIIAFTISISNLALSFFFFFKMPLVSRILCVTILLMAFFALR